MDVREKIEQFTSVTNTSEDIAVTYLEACAGDVNMAIGMHLENQVLDQSATPAEPAPELLSPKTYERIHGIRAPIPQTSGVLIEEEPPPRRILRTRKLPQTVFDPFQDYSAVSRTAHSSKHGSDSTKQKLADMFRPPHDLLFNGTFQEAKLAGQQKKRWLLVNLQDSREFASQILNRDVWSDYNVKELIQRNFLFMQIHRINDEGIQFKQLYHIDSLPSIAVIDPRTGEKMVSWGPLTAVKFIQEITEFLVNNPYEDEGQTNLPNQRSMINLSEESQLEAAIQASLEAQTDSPTLMFSDDSDTDYITISPERNSLTSAIKSAGQSTQLAERMNDYKDRVENHDTAGHNTTDHNLRKRTTNSNDDRLGEESRKKPRTDLDPMCAAINNIELTQPGVAHLPNKTVGRKGKRGRVNKGKGKAGRACEKGQMSYDPDRTVEELLVAGEIQREEVSQILFRLPDGSRLHKSFLCEEPIREMFRFLEDQGIDMGEHEVVTHFPKNSLLDMDRDTSFKQNGLYPRETVFIHTV